MRVYHHVERRRHLPPPLRASKPRRPRRSQRQGRALPDRPDAGLRHPFRHVTLGNVPSAWVGSGASAAAEFAYTVPPTESGHKCLFARAFAFSPLELPIDDFQLDPRLDRHVAQQNLNIVGQAQDSFRLVHAPNARLRIELRALEPEELLGLRHPMLADFQPAAEFPRRGWGRLAGLELKEPGGGGVSVTDAREGAGVESRDRDGSTWVPSAS